MRRAPRAPARALREFQASGPDRTAGVAAMNTPGRALSQKALVGISPAFGSGGLVSSPRSERSGPARLPPPSPVLEGETRLVLFLRSAGAAPLCSCVRAAWSTVPCANRIWAPRSGLNRIRARPLPLRAVRPTERTAQRL